MCSLQPLEPPRPLPQVDDTRQTLAYAVRELRADIAAQEAELAAGGRPAAQPTRLGVFVIHCKDKPKEGQLPDDVPHFVAQVRWGRAGLGG